MDTQTFSTERRAPIQSVERAIWILKCFETKSELSLSEISRTLKLHKSTTYGLVSTLEAYKLLEQDQQTGAYHLGIDLFRLGNKVNIDLRSIVSPYLDKLVVACGETVNFVIQEEDCIVYMDKRESPHSMRIATSLGQREPLYRTAAGKAILSSMPADAVKEILNRTKFERMTSNTLLSVCEVQKQLAEIRLNGFAVDREEMEYGLVCIGVAIRDHTGGPVGAISISGPSSRMRDDVIRANAQYLMDSVQQIEKMI